MVSHQLYPLVGILTRITHHSGTLIVNISVRFRLLAASYAFVIFRESSDHFPVVAVTSFLRKEKPKIKRTKKMLQKKDNIDRFRQELSAISWQEAYDEYESPSAAFDRFIGIVQSIIVSKYPMKIVKLKKSTPRKPWVSKFRFTGDVQ